MPTSAFITAVVPNFDSGIAAVPVSVAADVPNATSSLPLWLIGATFANTGSVNRTVRVTDGSGATFVPDIDVPAKSAVTLDWNLLPVTGLKWLASGTGVNGQLWGYE